MNNRNSIEWIRSIQCSLSELSNSLEDVYFKMRKECVDEIVGDIRRHELQKNEISNLYDELSKSEQRRIRLIKNRLPWHVTLFRTIRSYEISLRDTSIFIGVSFGKSQESCCYIEFTPKDMGWRNNVCEL